MPPILAPRRVRAAPRPTLDAPRRTRQETPPRGAPLPELAVTAVGADRPGIIARLTGVLLEHGGNLEDTAMTILSGQFAMVMVVSTDTTPAALEDALAEAVTDWGMIVGVAEVGPGARGAPATHVVSVYGSDRPGMVHAGAVAAVDRH